MSGKYYLQFISIEKHLILIKKYSFHNNNNDIISIIMIINIYLALKANKTWRVIRI